MPCNFLGCSQRIQYHMPAELMMATWTVHQSQLSHTMSSLWKSSTPCRDMPCNFLGYCQTFRHHITAVQMKMKRTFHLEYILYILRDLFLRLLLILDILHKHLFLYQVEQNQMDNLYRKTNPLHRSSCLLYISRTQRLHQGRVQPSNSICYYMFDNPNFQYVLY